MKNYFNAIFILTLVSSQAAYAAAASAAKSTTSATVSKTAPTTPATTPVKINASAPATIDSSATVTVADGIACGKGTACKVVSDTTTEAIKLINNDDIEQVTNVITPQFDFTLMTKYVMGNNWKLATPEQQTQLVSLFRQLLVHTYSTAISKFKGTKTHIVSATLSPIDTKKPEIQKAAIVSQIIMPNSGNNNPIKVEYDLTNNTGNWKAYDIKIENASLVTTYRSQFNELVQTGKVSGLIKGLQDKVYSVQKTKSGNE